MRILDEDGQEVKDPNLELGHLEPDKVFVMHHDEIPEQLPVTKIDYDNPIETYPNGGKLVKTIKVSDYQPHVPAWDEYEDILRYVLYTPEELEQIEEEKKAQEEAQKEAAEQAKKEQEEQAYKQLLTEQMFAAVQLSVMTMDLTDEQATTVSELYPEWAVNEKYDIGDIRRYDGKLYRALQASTGQEIYPPDQFVAGWKEIKDPEGGILPWVQPLGATDCYKKGDKVTHNGKIWVSEIDSNTYEPGVYGWKESK